MHRDFSSWDLFVSWAPMLVLIAVWVIFYRMGFTRQTKNVGDTLTAVQAHTAELSKIHQALERIASALEADRRA